MIQRIVRTNDLDIHITAFKAIILGIIQYSTSILGIMTGSQRKKLESCQRMILSWIFKRCNHNKLMEHDATLFLAKENDDDTEKIDKAIGFEDEISYRNKLEQVDLYPITHRIDRNLILLGAEAITERLTLKHMIKRQNSSRLGPYVKVVVASEKNRPTYFQKALERSLAFASAQLFNKLNPTLRKMIYDKEIFKDKLSKILQKIDVLDINGVPTETLRIDQQLQQVIRENAESGIHENLEFEENVNECLNQQNP